MRVNQSRLLDLIAQAEKGYGGNIIDQLALDLRDTQEAVKVLRDRLDKAQEEIKALLALSESQEQALKMMESGRM